jgi:hypothetical protein
MIKEKLIEKYKRYIEKMEREIKTTDDVGLIYLEGKISAYRMVIIDLNCTK